jgi:undecaprenyl-diphosphatase
VSAFAAAALGVLQGVTEFLPVSSSAHLILARDLFGWDAGRFGLAFDVACHAGTLLAVVVYFRGTLTSLAAGALDSARGRGWAHGRPVALLVIGSLPIGVVGLALSGGLEDRLRTPALAATALGVGAVVFLVVERRGPGERLESSLGMGEALVIGIAQALALVPGVSRSGATIVAGLCFGMRREAAARFGFVLGIPAIAAATAREVLVVGHDAISTDMIWRFGIGAVVSGVVGYATVRYLMRYLAGHSLRAFAAYRLAVAALAPLWWMIRA